MGQGKAIAELKANSSAQELIMEECKRDVGVLQAERGTLKAQNASLKERIAEFHDEMKGMRRELMAARSDVQKSNGEMTAIKNEHFGKFAIADAHISRLQSELAQSLDAASSRTSAGQQEKVNAELRRYKEKAEKAESAIS